MKLGTWLLAMMQPLIAKILTSLGFALVSIVGMDVVIDQLKGQVMAQINGLPVDIVGLFGLAGGGIGLGIIFGAIATKLMLWKIQSATRILSANAA